MPPRRCVLPRISLLETASDDGMPESKSPGKNTSNIQVQNKLARPRHKKEGYTE
jgi:hypothetical protein